jgi:hypothetical protein
MEIFARHLAVRGQQGTKDLIMLRVCHLFHYCQVSEKLADFLLTHLQRGTLYCRTLE